MIGSGCDIGAGVLISADVVVDDETIVFRNGENGEQDASKLIGSIEVTKNLRIFEDRATQRINGACTSY